MDIINEKKSDNSVIASNIYCLHYLLPNNKLLEDVDFLSYFKNLKHKYYILSSNHICIHILDSLHYNTLAGKVNFNLYGKYVAITQQPEHSIELFKNLIKDFDINKINKIKVYSKKIENENKFIIQDGCHRLSILLFYNYSNIDKYISIL